MSFESAYAAGRARAGEHTAALLAEHLVLPERTLQPEPYLTHPNPNPRHPWDHESVRWPGRGLRIELGDRAYAALIIEARPPKPEPPS